jgi:hypothetical protein
LLKEKKKKFYLKAESRNLENLIPNYKNAFQPLEYSQNTNGLKEASEFTLEDFTQNSDTIQASFKEENAYETYKQNQKALKDLRITEMLSPLKSNPKLSDLCTQGLLRSTLQASHTSFPSLLHSPPEEAPLPESSLTPPYPTAPPLPPSTPQTTPQPPPQPTTSLPTSHPPSNSAQSQKSKAIEKALQLQNTQILHTNYYADQIKLHQSIREYEHNLFDQYEKRDVYLGNRGTILFSEFTVEQNLNYVKYNVFHPDELFGHFAQIKMYEGDMSVEDVARISASLIQKLALSFKVREQKKRVFIIAKYQYKQMLRIVKDNLNVFGNKEIVDTLFAVFRLHAASWSQFPSFYHHLVTDFIQNVGQVFVIFLGE